MQHNLRKFRPSHDAVEIQNAEHIGTALKNLIRKIVEDMKWRKYGWPTVNA